VKASTVVQVVIFLVVFAVLMYGVAKVAHGWASWVVFGGIVMAAVGGAIAINNRRFPAQGKKRSFTRDSSSRW
jgi:O-antigen/teichoic acid export membrane protein